MGSTDTRYWLTVKTTHLRIEVDNEGYLLNPDDWNQTVAGEIAERENIELEKLHWVVIEYIREQFELNQTVPETRHVLHMLKTSFDSQQGSRKALYRLFPYGYGQQACKIAGMRKPLKLMLDV